MGGTVRRRRESAEYASEALTRVSAPAVTRTSNRRIGFEYGRPMPSELGKARAAGASEGLRQRAMATRSAMQNVGATGLVMVLRRITDDHDPRGWRTITVALPMWPGDTVTDVTTPEDMVVEVISHAPRAGKAGQ